MKHLFLNAILLVSSAFAHAATWNVITAGAKPDGTSDNTAIFQRLLDEAGKAGGGEVTVPAGGRFASRGT